MRTLSLLPTPESFRSRLHNEKTAAYLGIALGVTFTICFVTGLLSHLIQHPTSWFEWPAAPRDLYRVITATHVVTGFTTMPLLLAKLWTVYPKLWHRPLFKSWAHAVERISLVPLVGGSLFLFVGGMNDSMYIIVNPFTFTPEHYLAAWVTMGALAIHIGAKRAVTLEALRRRATTAQQSAETSAPGQSAPGQSTPGRSTPGRSAPGRSAPGTSSAGTPAAPAVPALFGAGRLSDPDSDIERRRFLITTGVAAGLVGVSFLSANVSPLHKLALLSSRRSDVNTQGLPVQTTAKLAGVAALVTGPQYRLRVIGRVTNPLELDLAALLERVNHTATLPISCVQGWSVGATWRGVRVRDLLREAGVTDFTEVISRSVQIATKPARMFGRARLNRAHALHPDTLLATELNGQRLHIDHGFPARLIAPNNPGIMQTKWVEELWVR